MRGPGRLWWLCALALAAALAAPFFVVDVPPVLDYPNHLARIFILAQPRDPVLSQLWAPQWRILPNLGIDLIGTVLLQFASVHVGGRLLLALSLFAPLFGVVAYHRAVFRTWSLWPLGAGLIAVNGVFLLGFMNFLFGVGLGFAGAALWITLRRRASLPRAAAIGGVCSALAFLCHIFGVALLALLILTWEFAALVAARRAGEGTLRDTAQTALALAIAFAPAALLYVASPLSAAAGAPGVWRGLAKVPAALSPFMTSNADLTLLCAIAFVAVLLLGWRSMKAAPGFAISVAVLGGLFVIAPSSFKSGTFIDMRIMLMIVLLMFAGLSPDFSRRGAGLTVILFASLIGLRTLDIVTSWHAHRSDLAKVRDAIADVAPGTRVLAARGHPGHDTESAKPSRVLRGVYRLDGNLGALLVIERKAFWPLMFADPAQQPLAVLEPYKAIAASPGEPIDLPLLQGDDRLAPAYINGWRSKFDAVLLIDPPAPRAAIEGLKEVRANDYAVLYRVQPR